MSSLSCTALGLTATLISSNAERVIIQYRNPTTHEDWKSLIPASKAGSYRRPDFSFSKTGFVDMVNDDLSGLL